MAGYWRVKKIDDSRGMGNGINGYQLLDLSSMFNRDIGLTIINLYNTDNCQLMLTIPNQEICNLRTGGLTKMMTISIIHDIKRSQKL